MAIVEPGQFATELVANALVADAFTAASPYRADSEAFDTKVLTLVPGGQLADPQAVVDAIDNAHFVLAIAAAAAGASDVTPEEAVAASERYGNFAGMEFGYQLLSAAVIPDGTDPPEVADPVMTYLPSASPGMRAPHLWVDVDG